MVEDNVPFSKIGAFFGVSRNSAIGKAHRLGLQKRGHRPGPGRRPTVLSTDHLCTMFDLSDTTCRYPMWRDGAPFNEQFYCGSPQAKLSDGRPYCPGHEDICWNGIPQAKPKPQPEPPAPMMEAAE